MGKIIAAIPNICEGKDQGFIDGLTAKLQAVPGLVLLDVSMDKTRNRTVFAYTGSKNAVFDGGLILYEEALKQIDMRRHQGEYPRIGAVDAFPFVPTKDAGIEEAVQWAEAFAQRVAETFQIPVYLYGEAARLPQRREIENIREGEYEGLEERLKDPRWKPDLGPEVFKPDFGATLIGARYPMVSFKVYLNTSNLEHTRAICRGLTDGSGGGVRHVKTYAGVVYETGMCEITVAISNYRVTPMYRIIELLAVEGRRFGIDILNVEMIGLVPEQVFLDSALYYLRINSFSYERIVEKNIQAHLDEKLSFIS